VSIVVEYDVSIVQVADNIRDAVIKSVEYGTGEAEEEEAIFGRVDTHVPRGVGRGMLAFEHAEAGEHDAMLTAATPGAGGFVVLGRSRLQGCIRLLLVSSVVSFA
jgi:hypothetical protein